VRSQPYAQCYGGHQFGSWAGQLGDGRAITLGEIVNSKGDRWELQLKVKAAAVVSLHAPELAGLLGHGIEHVWCFWKLES